MTITQRFTLIVIIQLTQLSIVIRMLLLLTIASTTTLTLFISTAADIFIKVINRLILLLLSQGLIGLPPLAHIIGRFRKWMLCIAALLAQ